MKAGHKLSIGVGAVVLTVLSVAAPALAQGPQGRTVSQYLCKDVMRENGANRDVAIAFLSGFLLGQSGTESFDIDVLHRQSDAFIERCLDNPGQKAIDAMTAVKK